MQVGRVIKPSDQNARIAAAVVTLIIFLASIEMKAVGDTYIQNNVLILLRKTDEEKDFF